MAEDSTPTGFVDTHIHLIPGVDDGAETMEMALAMADMAIADGITHIIVTPHANYQFNFFPDRVNQLRSQMQTELGSRLQLMGGCEVHLSFENVRALEANPRLYSLNGSRYVLLEFPDFFDRTAFVPVLEGLVQSGLVPLLAHPERNPVLQQHPELLLAFLRMGCLTQVTASSFTGRFGKNAQQNASDLLQRHLVHVVASDAHSPTQRTPKLSSAYNYIAQHQSPEVADALCKLNPYAIAMDRDLAYCPDIPAEKKSLWARFRSPA